MTARSEMMIRRGCVRRGSGEEPGHADGERLAGCVVQIHSEMNASTWLEVAVLLREVATLAGDLIAREAVHLHPMGPRHRLAGLVGGRSDKLRAIAIGLHDGERRGVVELGVRFARLGRELVSSSVGRNTLTCFRAAVLIFCPQLLPAWLVSRVEVAERPGEAR